MKTLTLLITVLTLSINVYSQSLLVEKCKSSEVELQKYTGDLPDGYVVVNSPTYLFDRDVKTIDDLTEKEIHQLQKWARKIKACSVFVDFDNLYLDKKLNPTLTENHLTCLVTRKKE